MSLPQEYETPKAYFLEAMKFLKDYLWIYKSSNTKFVTEGILDEIPKEWIGACEALNTGELSQLLSDKNECQEQESLKKYLQQLEKLKPSYPPVYLPEEFQFNIRGVCPKKMHEIIRLSELIHNKCVGNTDILIDFGCGLGYLSEVLFTKYAFNVLGLESDPIRVRTSIDRQKKYYPDSFDCVYFERELISLDSRNFINRAIEKSFSKIKAPRLAIVGLHACADLSVTAIKLFFDMATVAKLIIMPCCYHKMQLVEDSSEEQCKFSNIPLSNALKQAIGETPGSEKAINRPFLRLACQQAASKWREMTPEEHTLHGNEMYIRGVLDAVLETSEFVTKNKNWKGTATEEMTFERIREKYHLKSKVNNRPHDWNVRHKEKFNEVITRYENGGKLTEVLTGLQTTLQELCENIVLYDRLCYVEEFAKESGIKVNASFRKIVEDKLSPRCYALIVEKI